MAPPSIPCFKAPVRNGTKKAMISSAIQALTQDNSEQCCSDCHHCYHGWYLLLKSSIRISSSVRKRAIERNEATVYTTRTRSRISNPKSQDPTAFQAPINYTSHDTNQESFRRKILLRERKGLAIFFLLMLLSYLTLECGCRHRCADPGVRWGGGRMILSCHVYRSTDQCWLHLGWLQMVETRTAGYWELVVWSIRKQQAW